MLQLLDLNKNKIAGLTEYKDLCIESVLKTGDKTLSFLYSNKSKYYDEIVEESYIRTKTNEYVVKEKNLQSNYTTFICKLNVEDIEGKEWDRFESIEQTIINALNLGIAGTGWTIGKTECDIKKKRTIRVTNSSSWDIIQQIKKTYRVEIEFDTINKKINLYEHIGTDKGTYFVDSLNLKSLNVQANSYDYVTRIIPVGKDGITIEDINNGKKYVENYQYTNKIKTLIWKDERYTIKENLKNDAIAKLDEISKPYRAYSLELINLAKLNDKYKDVLDYSLGDTITILSKENNIKEKQRIVKIKEYPQDHTRDTVEIANTILRFEDIQQENQETTDTVNNITTDNGTIDGSTIDGIETNQIKDFKVNVLEAAEIHVIKGDIQDLNVAVLKAGQAILTKVDTSQLNALESKLQHALIGKADVNELNVAVERVGILEGKTLSVENQLAGNLTAKNFKANSITAGSGIIAEGAIGDAEISNLSGNKLRFGTIDTSLVSILGPNGRLRLQGNKLQVLDNKNGKLFERVMLGVDDNNNSSLVLRGSDGKTVLLNQDGLTKEGITEGFEKVDDNSLDAKKFDKNSLVREINGATEIIKGTRIQIGDRTLDVELSTQKNTITEHGKELSNQKATINALDNAIKLKVDNQTFTQSTETINSNINKAKEDAVNTAKTNTTNAINNLKIGGRNLAQLTIPKEYTAFTGKENDCQMPYEILLNTLNVGDTITISFVFSYENLVTVQGRNDYSIRLQGSGDVVGWHDGAFPNLDISKKIQWGNGHTGSFKVVYNAPITSNVKKNTKWYSNFRMDYIKSGKVAVKEFMVEYGTKESAYTSAPEDVRAYADSKKNEAIKVAENLASEKSNLAKKYAEDVAVAKSELAKQQAIASADGKISVEEKKRIQQAEANLNTAIARADKAKADAISEANRVSELKKNEAIKTASTDATNKANSALNSAKAYTNAQVTTVNSNLSKATSEINILKNQISTKVGQSDIDKSIQEIKFNDVNMLFNGANFKDTSHWSITNGSENLFVENNYLVAKFKNYANWGCYLTNDSLRNIPLDTSKKYTVVCKLKASRNQAVNFQIIDGDGSNFVSGSHFELTTNWNIFKYTFIPSQKGNERQFRFITSNLGYEFDLYIEFVKMVEGATSSDVWTSNPLEVNQTIVDNIKVVTDKINDVSTKFIQAKDSLQASVNSLNSITQTITTNLTNTTNDLSNKINTAKADAINSSNAYTNTAKQQAIDTANSHANNIAETKKNEAIIDARKIPDTRNDNQNPDWYIKNYARQTITEFKFANIIKIPNGGSVYGTLETKVPWGDSSGGYPTQTFKSNSYPTYQRHGISNTAWSAWEQIEDTQGSQAKANNALNSANAYTTAQITTVNTRVSNAESSINILKGQISTKVSQSDIDKVSTSINNKINTVTEKINTVETTFTQKTNNINATVSNVQSILNTKADGNTVSSVQNQLASLNINVNGISQKVTDNTNRLKSAELKLEPGKIFAAVNATLASGDSIGTILSLTNKALTVYNTDNTSVVVGEGMVRTYDNEGNMSAKLGNNQISFYDWIDNTGDILGQISSVKKTGANEKGTMFAGGDYAQYISLGFDETWGDDSNFKSYLEFRKKSIIKSFKEISMEGYNIQNVKGINNLLDRETWINRLYLEGAQVNTNASDNNLWLNYWRGNNTTNGKEVNVRIGSGRNDGSHGGLVVGDLWVHGSKHRIVDCGDLGFVGMEAYETATPYFGDIGHGITNENGECYIIFDKEFIEVSNTSIEYMVIVQDEGKTKDTWVKPVKKNINGFLVKGSPNTPFSYEVKAIQKGFEKNRFKKLGEERSLKTNFGINNHLMKQKEKYKNDILGVTVMDDIEENRRLRYKSLFTNKEENKAMEMLNYTKGLKLNG